MLDTKEEKLGGSWLETRWIIMDYIAKQCEYVMMIWIRNSDFMWRYVL
jgi:hypothetical protein